jgi:hypothetical protein
MPLFNGAAFLTLQQRLLARVNQNETLFSVRQIDSPVRISPSGSRVGFGVLWPL